MSAYNDVYIQHQWESRAKYSKKRTDNGESKMMTPENEFDFDSDSTISNDENDAEIEEGEEEPKRKKKRKNNIYNAFIKVHRDSLTHEYKRRGVCNKEMYQDIIQNYKRLSSTKKEIWHGLLKKRSFSLTLGVCKRLVPAR